jgi:S-adenosylmethionine decarboxylase proenzyme
MSRSLGTHILIEYYGCPPERLNDPARIREAMLEAARRARATIVTDVFHRFNPHGVSGVVVIAESHVAIHTWPEHGCASVDVFSCGNTMEPRVIEGFLRQALGAAHSERREIERGVIPVAPGPAIEMPMALPPC